MPALRAAQALRPAIRSLHAASLNSTRCFSSASIRMASNKAFIQGEPDAPVLKASIPGPQSAKRIAELGEVFDTRSINMMTDFTKSIGNYISDPDGNYLLDV